MLPGDRGAPARREGCAPTQQQRCSRTRGVFTCPPFVLGPVHLLHKHLWQYLTKPTVTRRHELRLMFSQVFLLHGGKSQLPTKPVAPAGFFPPPITIISIKVQVLFFMPRYSFLNPYFVRISSCPQSKRVWVCALDKCFWVLADSPDLRDDNFSLH